MSFRTFESCPLTPVWSKEWLTEDCQDRYQFSLWWYSLSSRQRVTTPWSRPMGEDHVSALPSLWGIYDFLYEIPGHSHTKMVLLIWLFVALYPRNLKDKTIQVKLNSMVHYLGICVHTHPVLLFCSSSVFLSHHSSSSLQHQPSEQGLS